jgi:putative transposase
VSSSRAIPHTNDRGVACPIALVRLLVVFLRTLDDTRVPSGTTKTRILNAVDHAARVFGRRAALRIVGLTDDDRARQWKKRELVCTLDDLPPCPRTFPSRLTRDERNAVRELVEDDRHKHIPIRSLALLGKRLGRVFASAGTRSRLIREHGWRRPRARLYPAKRTVGIRATAPNEWWHVDVTIIRLLDGTKLYLHGVLDYYSRKLLAWTLEPVLRAEGTRAILLEAIAGVPANAKVNVMTDGGSENLIIAKDTDLAAVAEHIVAQTAIHFSNSMIEAFWKQLKHQWLYLHHLDSIATLRRLVTAYVQDHNDLIPRVELRARTPDEAYALAEVDLAERLATAHTDARRNRITANRALQCASCVPIPDHLRSAP